MKDILDKAIKSHGGEEKLASLKAARTKTKGTIELGGGLAFTQEVVYQVPDKFKESMDLTVNGNQVRVITTVNKDKASIVANGQAVDLTDAIKAELKEAINAAVSPAKKSRTSCRFSAS